MPIILTCKECGNDFKVPPSRAKVAMFCSSKCSYENQKKRDTPNRKNVNCAHCGIEFRLYNNQLRKNNFCSMDCHDNFRKIRVDVTCKNCGNVFQVKKSTSKLNPGYCSLKCRNEGFNGPNSPLFTKQLKFCRQCGEEFFANNYDPGKYCSKQCRYDSQKCERPSDSERFYTLSFWHKLRNECFERDGHKCSRCGTDGKRLHAHHIIPRRDNGLDELSNLISLCVSCHRIVENEYRKQNEK